MGRLLGYLGKPIQLDRLLYQPEHSLVVQSYQPKEMMAGLLNADGFGLGWYGQDKQSYLYLWISTSPSIGGFSDYLVCQIIKNLGLKPRRSRTALYGRILVVTDPPRRWRHKA